MRRSTKKKVIPLALALALALIGATLAVPTIQMHVQQIGVGDATSGAEITSPVGEAWLDWGLSTSNPDILSSVTLKFDQDVPAGSTIYVKFYNSGSYIDSVQYSVTSAISAGTTVPIDVSSLNLDISDFDEVKIIVVGPSVTS